MKLLRLLSLSAASLLPALALGQATVAVPRLLPYQGRLVNTDGTPVAGSPRLTFCVYGGATGGDPLWCEDQSAPLRNGFYAVFLGAARPFEASLFDGSARWLGVAVDGGTEMTPRQQIASVAYAITATSALQAANATAAGTAGEAQHAAEADHAASATVATSALHATSADSATKVPNADYAKEAGKAASATLAERATTADQASNATSAVTASTYSGEEALKARVSALEGAGPSKTVFGYVAANGLLLQSGPRGGLPVEIKRSEAGTYLIQGTGIGDGVLLVTRETTGGDYSGGDDVYVRVHIDGHDQFTVLFSANDGARHDVGWFFHILMP